MPGDLAGVLLSWPVERTDIPVSSLEAPVVARPQEGIRYSSLEDAMSRVEELRASVPTATSSPGTGTFPATP